MLYDSRRHTSEYVLIAGVNSILLSFSAVPFVAFLHQPCLCSINAEVYALNRQQHTTIFFVSIVSIK